MIDISSEIEPQNWVDGVLLRIISGPPSAMSYNWFFLVSMQVMIFAVYHFNIPIVSTCFSHKISQQLFKTNS